MKLDRVVKLESVRIDLTAEEADRLARIIDYFVDADDTDDDQDVPFASDLFSQLCDMRAVS